MKKNVKKNKLWVVAGLVIILCGCWDETEHEYDDNEPTANSDDNNSDTDTIGNSGTDSGNDSDTTSGGEKRNSVLADDWAGFGSGCEEVSECAGYPAADKRCLQNVMKLVDSPGGYCTACCNEPGEGVCGPGVDCVGAYNQFLICMERCETDADCRTEEHYECRAGLYYMETIFPGKYCLPDSEHAAVPENEPPQNTTCPWPW